MSLVASHTVVDGLGFVSAIADAASGRTRDLGYPGPGSRSRRRAIAEDGRQFIASTPQLGRALRATIRLARQRRMGVAASFKRSGPRSTRKLGRELAVVVPTATAFIGLDDWDVRARAIGGNSHTLLAGFASRVGVRLGRVDGNGMVTLSLPISDRTADDTRGNAMVLPVASVDPTNLASDLSDVRIKAKQAFADLAATSDQVLAPLPLTSVAPKWLARRAAQIGMGSAQLPIGCSNLGDFDPAVNRPDGTDAAYASGRLIEPGITKRVLDGMRGQLFVVSGRIHGRVFISVNAYLDGMEKSQDALREVTERTLAEFDLSAEIFC
ncbi:hypothetical protein [Mycobacterium vicinigordonae]|uniref:Diacylglycerol O-acyltransferase n=1 Tax=Mycobacterium vicinigordonae TaxID=1719132 RepID=A0A7D6E9I3_9MYCO|nr:hypothetical protein [Mycobacterium vicinigordonae]QLL09623.1 hypothetical protein H0P51_12580 [Mycobacterium vicinigordonae]